MTAEPDNDRKFDDRTTPASEKPRSIGKTSHLRKASGQYILHQKYVFHFLESNYNIRNLWFISRWGAGGEDSIEITPRAFE